MQNELGTILDFENIIYTKTWPYMLKNTAFQMIRKSLYNKVYFWSWYKVSNIIYYFLYISGALISNISLYDLNGFKLHVAVLRCALHTCTCTCTGIY